MAGIGSLFRSVIIQKADSVPEYISDLKIRKTSDTNIEKELGRGWVPLT